jgi:hypothetical protein
MRAISEENKASLAGGFMVSAITLAVDVVLKRNGCDTPALIIPPAVAAVVWAQSPLTILRSFHGMVGGLAGAALPLLFANTAIQVAAPPNNPDTPAAIQPAHNNTYTPS